MVNDVDFVLPWVDGSDPAWLSQFDHYTNGLHGDKRKSRYRDWANLKYMFRAFEKCTPWVRKIHFVTCGHLPAWLNLEHEKLNIVRHTDFLASENLPVFSSHPIEINLHRIPGLAEHFVYFNDDTFLLKKVAQKQFFRNGLPRDILAFNAISDSMIANIKINNIQIIHQHFDKSWVVKKNFSKIFNLRTNFLEIVKTLLLMPWPKITGFYDPHLPQPFLKSTFNELWETEPEILSKTSASKVRNCSDVNQYLFRYWHLCKGEFVPIGFRRKYGEWVRNYEDAVEFHDRIISGKYDMACINDGVMDEYEFPRVKAKINQAFEVLFPEKSLFEK